MRTLILTLSLLISFNSLASDSFSDHQNSIQAGKISAIYLNNLDEEIKKTEARIELAISNLDEPVSMDEGRIIAGMINMIEAELTIVKKLRLDLESNEDIADADVAPIKDKIELIKELVAGLAS